MKNKIVLSIALIILGFWANAQHDMKNMSMPKHQTEPTIYTCVMNPEVQATKPGNCPKA